MSVYLGSKKVAGSLYGAEVTIFEGQLLGDTELNTNFKPYRKLLITYCVYDYTSTNTSGASNIMIMDLETTSNKYDDYVVTNQHPYNMYSSDGTVTKSMGIACKVSADKTTFTAKFMYNQTIATNSNYYVSKIVGII